MERVVIRSNSKFLACSARHRRLQASIWLCAMAACVAFAPGGAAFGQTCGAGTPGPNNCDPALEHGNGGTTACLNKCVGETLDCTATFRYLDQLLDPFVVKGAFNMVRGTVRDPAVGNLPIISVQGNAVCTDNGGACNPATGANCAFPCLVGPGGKACGDAGSGLNLPGAPQNGAVRVADRNMYTILASDVGNLPNTFSFTQRDLCDSACSDCPANDDTATASSNTVVPNCNDNDACTVDCCVAGVCSHASDCSGATCRNPDGIIRTVPANSCPDSNVCTDDVCVTIDPAHPVPGRTADQCCTNPPTPCTPQDVCHTCSCDPITGVHQKSRCDADSPSPVVCNDGDPATVDLCDDTLTSASPACCTSCGVKVDKQVSCDGVNWFDVGLVANNNDGTNGAVPGCTVNSTVYVRYQVANVGHEDVNNCTLSESNTVIRPGNTVESGVTIGFGVTLDPTDPDSDQNCTSSLEAQEPNTATLHCDCVQPNSPPLSVQAQDSATVECVPICGDNLAGDTKGETCDGTDAGTAGCSAAGSGAPDACRANCTCCGDGHLDAGEQCDDGNNTNHDGCSATCQLETCAVKVDKQVSCDGVNWFDAGLVANNEDGTSGPIPGCIVNSTVYVRYQVSNVGAVNVDNCTLSESNTVIRPGNTVQSGVSIGFGVTLDPTAPDSDQSCTDALEAQEPNTATLDCQCVRGPTFPPLSAQAHDSATIGCNAICGDGVVGNTPGETCDPPGSVQSNGNVCRKDCTYCGDNSTNSSEMCDGTSAGSNGCSAGNSGAPDACRTNCTCCGDGHLDAGEQCDDGNNTSHDGCSASCQIETCAVQVDKQVSCDGVNWFDAGLHGGERGQHRLRRDARSNRSRQQPELHRRPGGAGTQYGHAGLSVRAGADVPASKRSRSR
ncbi:MAG: hypothetical protein HY287_05720 [Planctomycetes bacterium]|nr:hypothetical protein [Planctomycetota bacterium]